MTEFYNWNVARTNDELASLLESGKDAINFMPTTAEKSKRYVNQLCSILEQNTTCRALSLSRYGITSREAAIIADMLMANTCLVYLNLSYNVIGNEGAEALSKSLGRNATLTFLNIAFNKFNDDGASSFLAVLRDNFTLRTLKLSTAFCQETTTTDIKALLSRNRRLLRHSMNGSSSKARSQGSNSAKKITILKSKKKSKKKFGRSMKKSSGKSSAGYSNSMGTVSSDMSSLNPLYQNEEERGL